MENIRNFAIIAHIDHGKSTLADRLLEITRTVEKNQMREQFLDQNPISRERGITIKLAPVRMHYGAHTLNLIDTPGHIDFSYEVSRTLSSCEGVVLLVDATQGIQAQTVAHFQSVKTLGLKVIPVVNKIDMQIARVDETIDQISETFGFEKEEILKVSAKTGQGVHELLDKVVEKIPPPQSLNNNILRALIFDALYDDHRGVVAFVRVFDGEVKRGDRVHFLQSKVSSVVSDVGYFSPSLVSNSNLSAGEIGYIVTGVKNIRTARVGDTISNSSNSQPLPGYKTPQPMVFFGIYPKDQNDLPKLKEGLQRLSLNDASLTIDSEYSSYLGTGFRVGFLGLLHAEIVKERLKNEEGIDPLFTKPQVLYKKEGETTLEPYMKLTIYTPKDYVGSLINLCEKRKGNMINIEYHKNNATLGYEMPYSSLLANLTSDIKSITSGFASLDYEILDYREANLVNLEIVINDTPVDVLSEVVYKDEVAYKGREKVDKLKEFLPRQQFRQVIQAKIGGDIVARSEIPPFRKDVLSKMSGGDRTRKDKLLEKQKKGKAKMFKTARIDIPQKALFSLIEN
jgi:GTP-binding protein LepA